MKAVAPNLMRFFEDESCGQCTPCRAGTEKAVKPMATGPGDKTLLTELSDALRRLDLRAGPGCAQPAAERVQVFPGGAGEAARELVMKMLPHIKCRSRKGGNPYSRNLRVWHDGFPQRGPRDASVVGGPSRGRRCEFGWTHERGRGQQAQYLQHRRSRGRHSR